MSGRFVRAKRGSRCPVCDGQGCAIGESVILCWRVQSDRRVKSGAWLHRTGESRQPREYRIAQPQIVAALDRRHSVYSALLDMLTLDGRHSDDLLRRGLGDVEAVRNGYASLPQSSNHISHICRELNSDHYLGNVPGFFRDYEDYWTFTAKKPGFLIPVRDEQGRIQACQIRQDAGTRYLWFSSPNRKEGASSGAPVHFARSYRCSSTGEAIITEGPLKADIIAERLDACVVAVAGVSSFGDNFGAWLRERLPTLRLVMIALDSDWHYKPQVELAMLRLMASVEGAGLAGGLLDWDVAKGLDDVLTQEEVAYERNR